MKYRIRVNIDLAGHGFDVVLKAIDEDDLDDIVYDLYGKVDSIEILSERKLD